MSTMLAQARTQTEDLKRARALAVKTYRALRNLPDRLLHRRRHSEVRRRIARMARPRSILVVCHGNICRSPYLHAVLQRALPDIKVLSAGFIGHDRSVPRLSLEVSSRRGIDLSEFRSRPLIPEIVRRADLIIVMEANQAVYLQRVFAVPAGRLVLAGDLDPLTCATRAIPDPWMQPVHVFEASFDRLDRSAATLVEMFNRDARENATQPLASETAR